MDLLFWMGVQRGQITLQYRVYHWQAQCRLLTSTVLPYFTLIGAAVSVVQLTKSVRNKFADVHWFYYVQFFYFLIQLIVLFFRSFILDSNMFNWQIFNEQKFVLFLKTLFISLRAKLKAIEKVSIVFCWSCCWSFWIFVLSNLHTVTE